MAQDEQYRLPGRIMPRKLAPSRRRIQGIRLHPAEYGDQVIEKGRIGVRRAMASSSTMNSSTFSAFSTTKRAKGD
ncbi:MAG: hypothetical protein IPJ40_18300 [Saprospirales bacterium]|nr:hypothetical protein [Saprospirales bacterium]